MENSLNVKYNPVKPFLFGDSIQIQYGWLQFKINATHCTLTYEFEILFILNEHKYNVGLNN